MSRAPQLSIWAQIRQTYADFSELHGPRQALLELLLLPPLMVAVIFTLLFAAPILEIMIHG